MNTLGTGSPLSTTPKPPGPSQPCEGKTGRRRPTLGSLRHHPPQSTPASTTNSVTPPLYRTETNTPGPGGSYIVIDLHTRTHTPHTHAEKHHPEPRACAHDGPHPQLHFPAPARLFGKHTLRSSSQRTQKHSSARPRGAPSNRNDLRTQITSP